MKPWYKLSDREVKELQKQKCGGCDHLAVISNDARYCNYILVNHESRGCDPRECDKYVPRDEEKRNRPIF